jgi:hypothetical protein
VTTRIGTPVSPRSSGSRCHRANHPGFIPSGLEKDENGVCIVDASRSRCGRLLIIDRCPFCGRKHTHGMPSGHRVPHCPRPLGPSGGYLVREKGPPAAQVKRKQARAPQDDSGVRRRGLQSVTVGELDAATTRSPA